MENVKGLFSHDKGRTFGTIIQALDELGYVTEWGLFNSKFWGVPQNRERVYILVTRKDKYSQPKLFDLLKQQTEVNTKLVGVLEDDVDEKYFISEEKTKKLTLDTMQSEDSKSEVTINQIGNIVDNKETFGGNPQRGRVYNAEGLSPALNCMRGGGLEPKIVVLGNTSNTGHNSQDVHDIEGISPTIAARDYKGAKQIAVPVLTPDRINKRQNGRRFKEDGEPMFTLTSQDRHGVVVKNNSMKIHNFYTKDNMVVSEEVFSKDPFEYDYEYIDPEFIKIGKYYLIVNQEGSQAEVLTELSEGTYETVRIIFDSDEIERLELIVSKESMGRMGEQAIETFIANSCKQGDTINAYNRTVDNSGLSPTLTTRPEGFKTAILPITSNLRIRKLTPLECWRLQGFTDEQFYKAKNDGVSNSQLYKQAGNSVTVNVIDAIVKML